MTPYLSDQIDYLTRQLQREQSKRRALETRLERIYDETQAELAHIERDGGCAGFALRIERLSQKEANP